MDGIMDGIGAPGMQISHVSHGSLFPVLALIIFSSVLLYNLVRIIIAVKRRRDLYTAAGMIIDGHDALEKDKKIVTIDGEALTNDFVRNEIEKNKKKIDRIRKMKHPESALDEDGSKGDPQKVLATKMKKTDRKNKMEKKAQDASGNAPLASKKEKRRKREGALDAGQVLNMAYVEDDLFYDALQAYYAAKLPAISDPDVRTNVLAHCNKGVKKKRGAKNDITAQDDSVSVFN